MVVDSSALVAVILRETAVPLLNAALANAVRVRLSAGSYLESSIVMARRRGELGVGELDRLVEQFGMSVEPVDLDQARLARAAYLRYGKGRHEAALNVGDCFSYALARQRDEPLLFVGDDFGRTDIESAVR